MNNKEEVVPVEVGERCLLKIDSGGFGNRSDVNEYKILEYSPSGKWIKLMNLHGNKFWNLVESVRFVEKLKSIEKPIGKDEH